MAIEKRQLTVGDYTYEVTQLDAIKGRRTFVKLANAIGPAFKFANSPGALVGNLLTDMKPEDLDYFCDLFGEYSTVTGGEYGEKSPQLKGKVFMDHFAGNYLALTEWLVFSVQTNFSSFFGGITALMERLMPSAPAPEEAKPAAGVSAAAS